MIKALALLLSASVSALASSAIITDAFEFTDNDYIYTNGAGIEIRGKSVLVKDTNLEWLPLNFATSYSVSDMESLILPGNEFHGWQIASYSNVLSLLNAFIDVPIDTTDRSIKPELNGAFIYFSRYFGATDMVFPVSHGMFDDAPAESYAGLCDPSCMEFFGTTVLIFMDYRDASSNTGDVLYMRPWLSGSEGRTSLMSTFLIRPVEVSLPSVIALLLMGILGIALARRYVRNKD